MISLGCRATVPIHVWEPAQVTTPSGSKIALMPIAGNPALAQRIERELLAQRPAARADVAMFTAEQLAQNSPIRLVSTASLTSELAAIHAARAVGADVLVQGEILSVRLEPTPIDQAETPAILNMNQVFFQRRQKKPSKNESLLMSWRVIDARTSETLGTKSFTLWTAQAEKQYPDLLVSHVDSTSLLIAATARESWKSLAPVVAKDNVRLSVPWLQPGAWRVRRGVAAARRGEWEKAETQWQIAAKYIPFNAAAQHNLAIAYAAREDFPSAKTQLQKAKGLLAIRLPNETLFWLDQNHRRYHEAHGIGPPAEGWAFPEPVEDEFLAAAPPIEIEELPWWTAVPFTKPPGWTWQGWLQQPIVF